MKFIVVCVLAIALFGAHAEAGILGSLVGAISNGVNNVVSSVGNTIDSISNAIDLAVLGGQFLWDNAFNPALQTLTNNGAQFIDQYFGGILNAVGKRDAADIIAQRDMVKLNFNIQMTTVIAGLKNIFFTFLKEAKQIILASAQGILSGQMNIKDVLMQLAENAKLAVQQLIASVAASISPSLKSLKLRDNQLETRITQILDAIHDAAATAFNFLASYLVLGYSNLSNLFGK